jgi:2-polyprenyl-6-hydroxyphenyl methylase/3-demethylubiquinone-9 3-methyltransferase
MRLMDESRNVDADEIARFDRLADEWWNPDGEMGPLHAINRPRVAYVEQCAGALPGKRALDVGCGGGILAETLAAKGAQVTGIDLAADVLQAARKHAASAKRSIDYRELAAEDLAREAPGAFDLVCCMEMLEHVPQPEQVIAACATLVKPGGDVIFSTINRNAKAFALAIVGAEYLLNLIPRGTHDYAKLIRPSELERWSRAAGLQVRGVRGIRYNPLLKTGSLADDVDVNYLMHCRRPG